MLQAIGYVRRSTDRQEESLDQQRAKLESYAKAKGWHLVHVYVDDAISGSDMDRPGLRDLILRAETDKTVQVVLIWDRNRLARPKDPVEGMMLERRLLAAGKRIVYAATGQEVDSSFASKLMGLVEHQQNGDYLRKLSRDTARGVLSRVKRGRWPGGPIPFGYDRLFVDQDGTPRKIVRQLYDGSLDVLDAVTGDLIERIDQGRTFKKQDHEEVTLIPSEPSRVRAVQKMFADYANGLPTRRIREELNAAGFRSTFCRSFCIPSINAILENATYTGRCVYNKRTESKFHRLIDGQSVERQGEGWERRPACDWVITDNAWEAIIDAKTFERVQERRRQSREKNRHATGSATLSDYLLTGLCRCGVCGSKLTGSTTVNGKGVRTRYYVCGRHCRGDKKACPKHHTVPACTLEEHILGLIREDLISLRDDDDLYGFMAEEYRRLNGGQSDARQQLQRRLAELDQQAAKLRDHLKAVDTGTAQALGLYDEAKRMSEEKQAVERKAADLGSSGFELPSEAEVRAVAARGLEEFERTFTEGTLEEKRAVIGLYVESVKSDPEQNSVAISLYPALVSRKIGMAGHQLNFSSFLAQKSGCQSICCSKDCKGAFV